MHHEIRNKPDFASLHFTLDTGDQVVTEAGAMMGMSGKLNIETNMKGGLLGAASRALGGASVFLAANLYARSIFGEDALVNLSVEKKDDGDQRLIGYIRIRSKTQGIALSLGDRITAVQRTADSEEAQP